MSLFEPNWQLLGNKISVGGVNAPQIGGFAARFIHWRKRTPTRAVEMYWWPVKGGGRPQGKSPGLHER